MFFKVTSKANDGSQMIHYYNNITQQIYTDRGIPVSLAQDPRCQSMVDNYSIRPSKIDEPKQRSVRHLRIQLGLGCNFHCKYCNQARDRQATKTVRMPDSHVVKSFINKLIEAKIETNRITLWGGEPFVYYKLLKILVPKLKQLYPQAVISTISNGSMLDDEKVDWLIENKIQLTVSHDAFAFNVYRDDKNPLDNPTVVNAIKRYIHLSDQLRSDYDDIPSQSVKFSINVVITPENANILDIDQYFESKLGQPVRWHFEGVVKCDENNNDVIHKFDQQTATTLLTHMLIAGTSDPNGPYWSIRNKVSHLLGYLINQIDAHSIPYPCDIANSEILAVDLNGNILACHGSDPNEMSIGTIDNLSGAVNKKAIAWFDRARCKECPVLMTCLSGCCIASDKDNQIMCDNLKLWGSGIFAAAWRILFNGLVDKIEPVDDSVVQQLIGDI